MNAYPLDLSRKIVEALQRGMPKAKGRPALRRGHLLRQALRLGTFSGRTFASSRSTLAFQAPSDRGPYARQEVVDHGAGYGDLGRELRR